MVISGGDKFKVLLHMWLYSNKIRGCDTSFTASERAGTATAKHVDKELVDPYVV